MWALLAVGTLPFWIFMGVWTVLMVLSTEWRWDKKSNPTVGLILGSIFLTMFSDFNVFPCI